MKSNIFWIFALMLLVATGAGAQNVNTNTFKLELNAPQYKDRTAYLLMYWNGDTYVQDSCIISNKGVGSIRTDKDMPAGQYLIYIKPDLQLDILLDEGQNDIKITLAKTIENSKVIGSRDTEILWQYIKEANLLTEKQAALTEKSNANLSDVEQAKLNTQMDEYNSLFEGKVDQLIAANQGTWASVFLKGLKSVDVPHKEPKTMEDVVANKQFVRQHYFDNLDFTDSRLLRTNYFYSYLDNYMENWVDQDATSLAQAASEIVGKAQGNQQVFEQLLSRFLNNSLNSKLMGMENTWARLAEDYIFDNPSIRMDSTELRNLRSQYEVIKENRIGMKAHNLSLETLNGDSLNLYDIEGDYLVLFFYNPTCGHCHKEIKTINEELYPKYKDRGVRFVTMNIFPEKTGWQNFVEELKIGDWYNLADPKHKSQYWIYYDTTAVPSVYLLDKDKKIIAKKIDEENLKKVLEILYNEDGTN